MTEEQFAKLMADGQHSIIREHSGAINLQHAVHVPSSTENALRGAQNRAVGESIQTKLDAYHNRLVASGRLAGYIRTDPRIIQTGPGMARIIGAGKVDYMAFSNDGVTYHFDAKSTSQEQGFSVSEKSKHQLDWLRDMHAGGFPAGYLVEWRAHKVCCWHHVSMIAGKRIRYSDGIRLTGVKWLDLFEE